MMQQITTRPFGALPDGTEVTAFTLVSGEVSAEIITFGAAMRAFRGPDRTGDVQSVVLGYTRLADYLLANERQGAIMGRFVNRIGGASFTLNGETARLVANDGPNTIHGGQEGFDRRNWTVIAANVRDGAPFVTLQIISPDGDQGFPGQVTVAVTYTLYADGRLSMRYEAQVSRATVLNLTNHAYFNLAGEGSGQITAHVFTIAADHMLPIDENILPTGEIRPVDGTLFDFRTPRALSGGIRQADPQIMLGRGYDHCYRLADHRRTAPVFAARVVDPASGRMLEVFTTEPGLQLHSGNVLSGRFAGDRGLTYRQSDGFCLEAQQFPDAPNRPEFPSSAVYPETGLRAETVYKLGLSH
jgi:aldose 1-epimerase